MKQNIYSKAKPFVKWVGGKTQLINSINESLPKKLFESNSITYIEPFVGGGAILFWILQRYSNIKKAVINDINPDLTTAYKTIKEKPSELVYILGDLQNDYLKLNEEKRKEFFLNKRDKFNTKLLDPVENTALFIFLNRTCFNGLYRVNSKGLFNVPFGKYENPKICDQETIFADSELLQKVEILTGDFEQTLKYATNNSFFYFDPPYKPLSETSSFNSYSKEEFNDNEQIRLGNFCKQIDLLGHSFILSNSDVKGKNKHDNFFDELYSDFEIKRVYATRMVNANADKRGKLTELLITNNIYTEQFMMTAEELFQMPHYQKIFMEAIGDIRIDEFAKNKYYSDIAKSKNYIQGIYYHATGGYGEIGLGSGLYLGKDKKALNNFYNCEGECGYIQIFKGNPKFLDLTFPGKLEEFEMMAIERHGNDAKKNYLKKMTLELNYDGIRYFDPIATGEEFILFNTDKVKRIDKIKDHKLVEL